MRKHGRVDDNQKAIIALLRDLNCSVISTASLGNGFPDIIVGVGGENFLFELKNPNKPKSAKKLTEAEQKWHEEWREQVATVENIGQILEIIGINIQ